ncbi:hypothetical protein B0H10DRAFT_2189601 [Mycena sp. CBHHK59/15]|nr:hypothetical protein B0H10DRAFT_2189601 [Mycena sp. CBHHK59/15]
MSYLSWGRSPTVSRSSRKSEDPSYPPAADSPLNTLPDTHTYAPPNVPYTPMLRPPPRRSQRALPSPLRGALTLLAFLPLPPTLAVVHLATGHAVLRVAPASHARFVAVPLVSSVRAAAAGGAVLTLPLVVLYYLLFFPTRPPAAEDFFDDDDADTMWQWAAYVVCGALALCLGAIAGALGTVCLPDSLMLSAAQAAEAGIVGGVIVCGALAVLALFTFLVLWDCARARAKFANANGSTAEL